MTCSRPNGPRLLQPRIPLERTPRLYGRDYLVRQEVSDVRNAPQRSCLPAGTRDDLLNRRQRYE